MSKYYDDDDYTLPDISDTGYDDFALSDEELDQYEDTQHIKLDELEHSMRYLEGFISQAKVEGLDDLDRLEDELEILNLEYLRFIEQGE